ncbi:Sodium transporter HKT1 [Vitis vinifera]|uniref:Sodium transporter HKT1 n=1 Tax=Vitis vinifera TaxID=29760 RepID=A0A438DC50_VITVI|nr:Sodium transporter HKT1 [Vitis vinifera]
MKKFPCFARKPVDVFNRSSTKLSCLQQSFRGLFSSLFYFLAFQVSPFWNQLGYFITVSLLGYMALKVSKPKTTSFMPSDVDVFFTSVSASTVSSMSAVEMEVFSDTQLVIMTVLMLVGGEIFTSMLGLQFVRSKYTRKANRENKAHLASIDYKSPNSKISFDQMNWVVHVVGSALIVLYLNLVPSAREVLKNKGLRILTFSVFTVVSTFSNCGFIPTNENMVVFKKNSGLLLILIPQILLGNTLFAPCLRFVIWVLVKITRRVEFNYMLKNSREISYDHLLPGLYSCLLAITVFGFILVQFLLLCFMEWNSEDLAGLNAYQKIVGVLFQTANSRHSGESIFDLSVISPAVLVLFVLTMYLPSHTSFLPIDGGEKTLQKEERRTDKRKYVEHLLLSQLSYLVIFVILVCIIEREKMKKDPLNFSVLNITIEIVSAYGNVGFSAGYHCNLQLKHEPHCKDLGYGFVGRWSNSGKFVLMFVMFFGRLKKFSMHGGRAWKLD